MTQIVAALIWVWVVLVLLLLGGCAWFQSPPKQGLAPGATIVYTGSPGSELFSVCDKGHLIYLTRTNPQVAVLKDGCNPSPAAVAALTEKDRTPPFTLPQPFLVQLVPPPGPPPVAAQLPTEPREPIVVRVEPACPVCGPEPTPAVRWPVDPNTASLDALERLPGVTAKGAQAIVRGRPYRTLEDLVKKKILSEADLQTLTPYLLIR